MASQPMKDESSCVTIRDGGLCVMMDGHFMMFKLCADNLVIIHKVHMHVLYVLSHN